MKRSVLNAVVGITNQILVLVIGLFTPRLFLLHFGSEVNGIVSSITQVFTYFILLEAGVGEASLQALYKPVAEGDKAAISSIVSATGVYYRKTGIYYAIAVVGFAVIFPFVTTSGVQDITIALLILIQGAVGVVSYYQYGKFQLLLAAEGKQYLRISLDSLTRVFANLLRIILILMGYGLIVVQSSYLIFCVLRAVFVHFYFKKKYSWLDLSVEPCLDAISQKNPAMVGTIAWLLFSNVDIIIITVFLNFSLASVYSLYATLFGYIGIITKTLSDSVSHILGQTYNSEKSRYAAKLDSFESYYYVLIFSAFGVAYRFMLPFLQIYTKGITDINYIDPLLPVLFLAINIISGIREPSTRTINYAGHYRQTMVRTIVELIINLVLSLIFVQFMGIYGPLIGTVIALLYRANDVIMYSNRRLLSRGSWSTYRRAVQNLLLLFLLIVVSDRIPFAIESYLSIILSAAVCLICYFILFFGLTSLTDPDALSTFVTAVKRIRHRE